MESNARDGKSKRGGEGENNRGDSDGENVIPIRQRAPLLRNIPTQQRHSTFLDVRRPSESTNTLGGLEDTALRRTLTFYQHAETCDELETEIFATPEALRQRALLRVDERVIAAAKKFYTLIEAGGGGGGGHKMTGTTIDRQRYLQFNMCLQRALFDDFDALDAIKIAAQDWESDCSPA